MYLSFRIVFWKNQCTLPRKVLPRACFSFDITLIIQDFSCICKSCPQLFTPWGVEIRHLFLSNMNKIQEIEKSSLAFCAVLWAASSTETPQSSATAASVCTRYPEWLILPRIGCGARYGQSVSTSSRSRGTASAASRTRRAFLKVNVPEKEIYHPRRVSSRAISGLPL